MTNSRLILLIIISYCLFDAAAPSETKTSVAGAAGKGISKAAADRCESKVQALESYGLKNPSSRKRRATRFTEEEINSYFALILSKRFHPSLKSIQFGFEAQNIDSVAMIDFDALSMSSTKTIAKLIAKMFTGTHHLQARGKVVTEAGKGSFQLSEARFDDSALPNFLVEQIISAVGRKQKPPLDPLQPSQLPYRIDHVDVQKGLIVVYQ